MFNVKGLWAFSISPILSYYDNNYIMDYHFSVEIQRNSVKRLEIHRNACGGERIYYG